MKLGVNIDHIATIRNARKGLEPSVLNAALICENAGANGITVHLREDRRHILDDDVFLLKENLKIPLNLEMAPTKEMLDIAIKVKPSFCCLVPEKREELTTEGGLDVLKMLDYLKEYIKHLNENNIQVSLFIEPSISQIQAAKFVNAQYIELHTGNFANSKNEFELLNQLSLLKNAALNAQKLNLKVNAGHGLNYNNVKYMCEIENIVELNIGHSIISKAVFVGLHNAVCQMKNLIS